MINPDRLKAIANLAAANLLQRAQRGESFSAADWRELRRLMKETGLAEASWIHDTLDDLAQAVGVAARTLESWRPTGAPIPVDGPFDELRLRIWAMARQTDARHKAKLAKATGPLATYLDELEPLIEKNKAFDKTKRDPLKKRQEEKLTVQIEGARKKQVEEAKACFRGLCGNLEKLLQRDLVATARTVHELAQQPAGKAEAAIQRHLRAIINRSILDVLGSKA